MNLESKLDVYFKSWNELDKIGGMNGRKFRCETFDNREIFVKARKKENWGWFEWGLRKEYRICSCLGDKIEFVPKSRLLMESEEFVIAGFDFIKQSDLRYRDLYQSDCNIRSIIDSLNDVLCWLYNNSDSISIQIDNIRGREQVTTNQSFQSMKDYIISERLREEVFFNNDYYDEYIGHMNNAADLLQCLYNKDRERLIHGDIQNPNNIIFTENKLKGIVDWEISGWFDYLYDVAYIESTYIDKPCVFNKSLDKNALTSVLHNGLDITRTKRDIIELYKIWPYYLEIENLSSSNSIYGEYSVSKELNVQKNMINNIIEDQGI